MITTSVILFRSIPLNIFFFLLVFKTIDSFTDYKTTFYVCTTWNNGQLIFLEATIVTQYNFRRNILFEFVTLVIYF